MNRTIVGSPKRIAAAVLLAGLAAFAGAVAAADEAAANLKDFQTTDVYGEAVVAYVVVKEDSEAREAELIAFVKDRTTPFKAPGSVHFLDALPKSGVGKILRRELRDRAAGV